MIGQLVNPPISGKGGSEWIWLFFFLRTLQVEPFF